HQVRPDAQARSAEARAALPEVAVGSRSGGAALGAEHGDADGPARPRDARAALRHGTARLRAGGGEDVRGEPGRRRGAGDGQRLEGAPGAARRRSGRLDFKVFEKQKPQKPCAFSDQPRRRHDAPGVLAPDPPLRRARHSRQEALAARAAPRVRHAPHQPRRRLARGAAVARPCRYLHYADLHARGARASEGAARQAPSARMTPGTAFLKAKGVSFSEHTYEYVEHGGTEVPAQALGVPEHAIVKTLVMEDEARKPLIVLIFVDGKVSTKNL